MYVEYGTYLLMDKKLVLGMRLCLYKPKTFLIHVVLCVWSAKDGDSKEIIVSELREILTKKQEIMRFLLPTTHHTYNKL